MYLGKPSSSADSRTRSRQTGASILSLKLGIFSIFRASFFALPQSICCQLVDFHQRQAQRLAQVPHRALDHVGGDGAREGGVSPAPLFMRPQDKLFADGARKIEVDVRHVAHGIGGEKTL